MTDDKARATIIELSERVPFHANLGIQIVQAEQGRGRALLPAVRHVLNHADTVHAGALFTAADVAAGAAVLPAVWSRLAEVEFTVRAAQVRYVAPARGAISAFAHFDEPQRVLNDLDSRGRAEVPVEVSLTDEARGQVASLVLHWHVRNRRTG
jgi:thioesterase domain-containing protein